MQRRAFLAAGLPVAGIVAGCTEAPSGVGDGQDDDRGDDGPDDHDTDDDHDDDHDEDPLFTLELVGADVAADDLLDLDVELADPAVSPDSPAALELTVTNATDDVLALTARHPWPFGVLPAWPQGRSGPMVTLWSDEYDETPHVETREGRLTGFDDEAEVTEELDVDGSVTRTYEVRADPPHLQAGTYESSTRATISPSEPGSDPTSALIGFVFTAEEERPRDDAVARVEEDPRVDEPPHEIERPEVSDDTAETDEEWNDHFLGEHIDEEPSLGFEVVDGVGPRFPELRDVAGPDEYRVHLLESSLERDATLALERADPEVRDRLEAVDFDTHLIVVVESGYGSGSLQHRWVRAEDVDDGVHLHGYYTWPYLQTDDLTSRQSVLVVERPADGADLARVSLTVSEDRRVHVNSTEGVVGVEE